MFTSTKKELEAKMSRGDSDVERRLNTDIRRRERDIEHLYRRLKLLEEFLKVEYVGQHYLPDHYAKKGKTS